MQQKWPPVKTLAPDARKPSGRKTAPAHDLQQGALRPTQGLDYGVLDSLTGYALRRAQNALYLHFSRAMPWPDVSPQRFAALVLVVRNPGLRQGVLAQAMGVHRSGGLRLVDWLDARGWIRRADDPQDRRSWTLYPTPEGLAALDTLTAAVRLHDAALVQAMGEAGGLLHPLLEQLAAVAHADAPAISPISSPPQP
jgi:DNA-binding MarR family transcriptional regulator